MKTMVIFAHPEFKNSRVNKRLLEELSKYSEVTLNNLTTKYPDEIINKEKEQQLLLKHDRIIFQYPMHWYNIPPLMRKWQDIVLEYGWAYGPNGDKLKNKEYFVAVSVGGTQDVYKKGGNNNYTIEELLRPMQQTANFIQMNYNSPFVIYGAPALDDDALDKSINKYIKYILS